MRDMPRRAEPPAFSSSARRLAKRASAKRRKMRPRTGVEYCPAFSPEFARNWSAAAHRRFSSVSLAVSFSDGATQRMTPSESGCVLQNFHFAIKLGGDRILCDLQVVMGLQVHPELRLHAKKLPEAQCCIRRDRTLALHDLVDAPRRHADALGETVLADLHSLEEVLSKHYAGMHWIEF